VRQGVRRLVPRLGVHLEAVLHLLHPADRLAGQRPQRAAQRGQLGGQERRPDGLQACGRQLGEQARRAGGQLGSGRQRLGQHLRPDLGRAGPGVHRARDQPVEREPQPDVLGGQVEGRQVSRRPHVPYRRCRAA
jgi:hypothetical protein